MSLKGKDNICDLNNGNLDAISFICVFNPDIFVQVSLPILALELDNETMLPSSPPGRPLCRVHRGKKGVLKFLISKVRDSLESDTVSEAEL